MTWLSGYRYRKSHTINQAAGAGTDYQVKIVTTYRAIMGATSTARDKVTNIENFIVGSYFTSPSCSSTADNIVARIQITTAAKNCKCAIYNLVGSSLVANSTTDERSVAVGTSNETFTYSGANPVLSADTQYVVVAWAESGAGGAFLRGEAGAVNQGKVDAQPYNGFPDPAVFVGNDNQYEIYANLTYSAGNTTSLHTHCQTDFDDVRFTDDDGDTELDYWLESKTDSVSATFWVEVADDLGAGNCDIYIYYGNTTASTTSSGANTFRFFDDFPGAALDAAKWDSIGIGTVAVGGGILSITIGANQERTLWAKQNTFGNAAIRARMKFGAIGGVGDVLRLYCRCQDKTVVRDSAISYFVYPFAANDDNLYNYGGAYYIAQAAVSSDWANYHIYDFTFTGQDYEAFQDGVSVVSGTDGGGSQQVSGYVGLAAQFTNIVGYWDWFLVRKFVDPEPAHSTWGSEEQWRKRLLVGVGV